MRKPAFIIKKWSVRAIVAIGAALGLSSCGGVFTTPKVYGPPPRGPEVVEDVYGPPVTGDSAVNNVEADHKTDRVL